MNNLKLPILKRKDKILMPRVRVQSNTNTMSSKTKDFIQKICNKKSPSVDMTRFGFVSNDKVISPLKAHLNRIMGKPTDRIIIPRRRPSTDSKVAKSKTNFDKNDKVKVARRRNTKSSFRTLRSMRRSYASLTGGRMKSMSCSPCRPTSMSIQAGPLVPLANKFTKKSWV